MRRAAVATALAAVSLTGCGSTDRAPPDAVASAFEHELHDIDRQLAGVAGVLPDSDPATRRHAVRLWQRTVRTDVELRRKLEFEAPAGASLRAAAAELRAAARDLARAAEAAAPPPSDGHLQAADAALAEAAAALH
jgi:hypothetical protein